MSANALPGFLEGPVATIAEEQGRLLVGRLRFARLYVVLNVSVDLKNIFPAIEIKVAEEDTESENRRGRLSNTDVHTIIMEDMG